MDNITAYAAPYAKNISYFIIYNMEDRNIKSFLSNYNEYNF